MQNETVKGCFIAVVGPSGAGKDTIMDAARDALKDDDQFHFVRRIITRPQMAGTEDHDSLNEVAFAKEKAEGAFALDWQAHGLSYALPRSLDQLIEAGTIVIANVSRRVLNDIRADYPQRSVVLISARSDVLAKRLAARGRETEEEIAARLAREVSFDNDADDVVIIDNSGSVTTAIDAFLRHLRSYKP